MGNYTLRTKQHEDEMIKDAQEYMGAATASKALLMAISKYKEDQETIFKLRKELENERKHSQRMSAGISDFEASMTRLFTLK